MTVNANGVVFLELENRVRRKILINVLLALSEDKIADQVLRTTGCHSSATVDTEH
jgi:hypothetical protein